MLQISLEVSVLSQSQREALAGFILSFPSSDQANDPVIPAPLMPEETEPSPEEAFTQHPAASMIDNTAVAVASALDKNGLPWDERIHSSSKVKTSDGSWRMKRGVDDAKAAAVSAELKALMAIPSAPAPPVDPVLVAALIPPAPAAAVVNTPAVITESLAPSATTAFVPPAPSVDDRQAFVSLITLASGAIGQKKLTQEELTSVVQTMGVPSLPLLANRLDLIPQVRNTLEMLIAAR